MLLALVLGGLAAAIAAPMVLFPSEEDETEPGDLGGEGGEVEDLLESLTSMPGEVPSPDEHHVLEGFEPGVDTFDVELDEADALIETGWDEDGVPYLSADTGDGVLTASFPGLDEVPGADVTFTIQAAPEEEPLTLTLTEVLELGAVPSMPETEPQQRPEDPFDHVNDTLEDLGGLSPVLPEIPDRSDKLPDHLPDVVPLVAEPGDAGQVVPDSLPDVAPLAPQPGDERDG